MERERKIKERKKYLTKTFGKRKRDYVRDGEEVRS